MGGPIDSAQTVIEFWHHKIVPSEFFSPDQKCLVAILMNSKFRVIGWDLISLGTLNESLAFTHVAGEALWCLQDPVYESVTLFSPSEPSLLRWLIQGEK